MKATSKTYDFNPEDILPSWVKDQIYKVLEWRDDIHRDILQHRESIPGLQTLIDSFVDDLNKRKHRRIPPLLHCNGSCYPFFTVVYAILTPYLTVSIWMLVLYTPSPNTPQPLIQQITSVLAEESKDVLDSDHVEQYAVRFAPSLRPLVPKF